ncbi:hypothetical protein TRIUR3_23669 [Triticum urartu]|uniref:Uncharacterized protein n=1 Tax=Triticum urartu TaxID=4572 RepID=M8A8C5_TRIUA|nr:hypothetical protein TRIUR3_23669 [Triticum urartu]
MALQWEQIGFSGAERRKIGGGATLVFDTELIAVNGKTSAGAAAESDDSEL